MIGNRCDIRVGISGSWHLSGAGLHPAQHHRRHRHRRPRPQKTPAIIGICGPRPARRRSSSYWHVAGEPCFLAAVGRLRAGHRRWCDPSGCGSGWGIWHAQRSVGTRNVPKTVRAGWPDHWSGIHVRHGSVRENLRPLTTIAENTMTAAGSALCSDLTCMLQVLPAISRFSTSLCRATPSVHRTHESRTSVTISP